MNKVLLNIFSTQISDQRGSKKSKKIIFLFTNFLTKKYKLLSKYFFQIYISLSKLTNTELFSYKWVFLTFTFNFSSGDILDGHAYYKKLDKLVGGAPFKNIGMGEGKFRNINFDLFNFQK